MTPHEIAADYVARWAKSWNDLGPEATAQLYTPDSMLIGAAMASGRAEIQKALTALFNLGWTKIDIKPVHVRAAGGLVLVASEFVASGSGPSAGKTLTGKSTHALAQIDGIWLSAMHTAA
jgi:uncharacterized protein (TIGR02246 family)